MRLQYVLRVRGRRIVARNLRIIVGEGADRDELRALSRRVFSNFGRSIYYFLRLPAIDREELRSCCDPNGILEVTRELSERGAFIIVGPHLGAWEVGGAWLSLSGLRLRTVALPHPSSSVTRFFDERRRLMGIECAPVNASVESLGEALNQGQSIALLIDRAYSENKRPFHWFNTTVELPVGHLALAVRCRVPVLTTACVFNGEDGFKFVWNGPHYPNTDVDHQAAMVELQAQCIKDMEMFVRNYPDQWYHFHPLGSGAA